MSRAKKIKIRAPTVAGGALVAAGADLECDAAADGGVDAVKAGLGASEEPAVSQGAVVGVPATDGFGEESAERRRWCSSALSLADSAVLLT
jgi:hypothetical protein